MKINDTFENVERFFSLKWLMYMHTAFLFHPILYLHNEDILNICMKEFGAKNIFGQFDSFENINNISLIWLLYAWANPLLPQLLFNESNTLPTQCRPIKHMHGGVWCHKINF